MALFGLFGGGNQADATISVNAKTDNAEKNLKMLTNTLKTVVSVYALKQLYDFTKALVKAGDEDKRMAKSFETMTQKINVSSDKMLADMNRVTHRVVQDANLQALAIKGIAQGFSKNEIVAMMELASNFALSTGEDVEQTISQMFEGGPRSAAMAMKRMGMDIEMVNGRIKLDIDEIKEKAKQLGDAVGNDEDSPVVVAAQLAKNFEEAKGQLGQLIGPVAIAGLQTFNTWMAKIVENINNINKPKEKGGGFGGAIGRGRIENTKKEIEELDKAINKIQNKTGFFGKIATGDSTEKLNELIARRKELVEKLDSLQPAPIDVIGTTKPDGDGNKKLKPTDIDPEATKAAADAAKKLATDAASAAESAREYVMKQSLDGRLKLIDEQESAEFALLSQAKITNEEAYQNIQKKYGDMRAQELQAEQDELNAIIEKEGERQLQGFEERQERKKAAEEKAAQDSIDIARKESEQRAEIRQSMYTAVGAASDAFTNFEIINLKRSAKSQEEYDKGLAEIQKSAANRQYAIMLWEKGAAFAVAIADAAAASVGAAKNTPGGVAVKIAAAIATGIELGATAAAIAATNVPTPKFRMGRLGRERRGGFGDIESAFIDPAETIVPATQSSMHREELRAIMNNTANTASGLRKIKGGSTVINYYSVPVEQLLQAQVQTQRRNAVGTRI